MCVCVCVHACISIFVYASMFAYPILENVFRRDIFTVTGALLQMLRKAHACVSQLFPDLTD